MEIQRRLSVRIVALAASMALLAALTGGSSAGAQSGPEFLPGDWVGEMWFWEEVRLEGSGVQHLGSGGLEFAGASHDATTLSGEGEQGPTTIEGALTFEVLVRAYSSLGKTERLYDGEWYLKGEGPEISIGGEVQVKEVDSAKLSQGEYVGVRVDFVTEVNGLVVLESASCAGLSGTFTTDLISPPGGSSGVAFFAPFTAVPGADAEVVRLFELVKVAAQGLFQLVYLGSFDEGGGIPADASWGGATPDQLREVLRKIWLLNQAIADSGVCSEAGDEFQAGGTAFAWLADLMLNIIDTVSQDADKGFYEAYELVDIYWLGASMGAFATPSELGTAVQERYPEVLSEKLFIAITDNDTATIDLIHAAAIQWGWDDLAEESAR